MLRSAAATLVLFSGSIVPQNLRGSELTCSVRQLTFGPRHHFFGYIGHVGTVPWNQSGRYIVALQTAFQDHMPDPEEAAEIVLIDVGAPRQPTLHIGEHRAAIRVVESTRAWNFQQGTMLYWNPQAPETQFFFNDRDPATGRVFTVLYDIETGRRVREYRDERISVGNSGVAQHGGQFLALNYGRLARLRPVTGYTRAFDWTDGDPAPSNDGVFCVDVATARMRLLVSFAQLRDELRRQLPHEWPDLTTKELFINHTLWSRDDERIYFYCRADFYLPGRINVPFTVRPDGSRLTMQHLIGGHVDWDLDRKIINHDAELYNVSLRRIVDKIPGFPPCGGDIALSPGGKLLVKGFRGSDGNQYVVLDRETGAKCQTAGFSRGSWSGDLRVDGAPCWNRRDDQILFAAVADDEHSTRQLFVIDLVRRRVSPNTNTDTPSPSAAGDR